MERLTRQDKLYDLNDKEQLTQFIKRWSLIKAKLTLLEDIEEELGIDLTKFYKNYRELLSLKGRNLKISIEELQKELEDGR